MFDESYDSYIRGILGYPAQSPMDFHGYSDTDYSSTYRQASNNRELEECYPEIYKIIYPMVTKACNSVQEPITKKLVEQLTNNIYLAIEGNNEVNININLTNEVRSGNTNTAKRENRQDDKEKTSRETRNISSANRNLRDLIQILIIRELLNRPGTRPPVRPPRPPFVGSGPIGPRPPMRPTIMPRDFDDSYFET